MKGPNRQESLRIVMNRNQRRQWELESSRSSPMGIVEIIVNGNRRNRQEWDHREWVRC